jgi:hypothetical protein
MLVEVQYHDESGSVCPFCGNGLALKPQEDAAQYIFIREDYSIKMFPCECLLGHLTFVSLETEEGDEYQYRTRMFTYYQDWEDHIDITITAGAYELDCLDDEDDAWIIHRKLEEEENAKGNTKAGSKKQDKESRRGDAKRTGKNA